MITDLKRLWKQAFGDPEDFIDSFFRTGYAEARCRCLTVDNKPAAALYWFDCFCEGQKWAYLYAIATGEDYRNQGLCRKLMTQTHDHLRSNGYAGSILVPGSRELFLFYEKLGYRTCCTVTEEDAAAGTPVLLRPVTQDEYAVLRRRLLPSGGLVQEGAALTFLETFAGFYAGDGFVLAASTDGDRAIVHELLGEADSAAITAALGVRTARLRKPGNGRPFAMCYPLKVAPVPAYLGLALD